MFLSRRPCPSGACSGSRSDLDDLGFDTTIDFDGLTFVFSGFAMQRRFKSLLAEFLANAFNGMNIYAEIFGDTSILVVGTACVSLELDAGSSDGLGWVLASAGEAGQELALFVGEGDGVFFQGAAAEWDNDQAALGNAVKRT